jgi:PAS domain S-box-containing protein
MPLISEPKHILVLFSYHRAEWSDNVQKGIESVFTPYQNVNFFYEYMDTKRLKTKEYLETLRKIYIEKYAKALIDMVICVDNNALDLLAENARTLLPDTPVVFCGINDYSPALHAARPDVTGVVEYGDFSDTLKIAFRARPNATKLYIICDHTETGETNTRDLIAALSTVAPGIQAVLMDRMSYEELFTTLQAADPQQVAIFVSFWKDGTGRNIEPWMLDAVFRKSAIPVFGRSEWMINHGMVGGKCVTGFAQGEAAARIALQILGGTPVSDLPVNTDSPNQYLFDHRMMQHFRIDEDIFPDKSIGFNRPEPFYRVSKTAGTNYLFFSLLLLTALVFLMLNIQQRRKAEKALLREKNIIDAILDSAPGMIYLYNDQGNLERWNKKHEEMSGYSPEEMNGRNVLDWFKGDDKSLSAVTDGLKNTFKNGHGEAEADLQRKDGSTIPMYFTATPLTMNDKPYFVGIGIDITERKQAEKALQESEEKFRNIADQSLVGIYLIQDGIFQYVNPKFSEIFGYPAEQYLGLPFDKLIYPEDRDTVEKNIRKRISGEVKTVHYEFRGIRKNSEIVHLEIFGSSTLFNGNPAITGTLLDITDRKRAEEERVLNVLRTKVLLQLNQMTEATLQEVTDFALEEAVRLTNSTIGYLAFLNDDESILTMHSWSKSAMAECGIADKPILYPVETTGLWGEAVRQRRAVITNDYTGAAALKKGYPEGHVAVRRHMNTPVFVGSRIVLVAGVGNKTAEYNQDDVQQLTLLMEGMWRLIERKRADESLRESENKYRLIAENTADLISILDMNLRFTYVSPASMRLRGFTVEEAMAQTLDQVLTPDSMRLAFAVFEKEMIMEASGTADPDRTRILE